MSKINKAIAALSVVASLGVSAAPMATFAATHTPNTQKDILNVTIEEVCAFGYDTIAPGSHADGSTTNYKNASNEAPGTADRAAAQDTPAAGGGYGKWNTTDVTGYDSISATTETTDDTADTDTAYGIMETNTVNPDFAKTTLNVVCNDKAGYQITAVTTDLSSTGATGTIASTSNAPAAGTSSWAFQIADTSTSTNNKGVVATDADGWYGGYFSATPIISTSSATGTDKSTLDTGDIWTMTYGVGISASQAAATYEGDVTYVLTDLGS